MKTPVYFYVKRKTSIKDGNIQQTIPFEVEVANIGKAMNLTSGVFVAPRSGTYFFIFSAMMNHEYERYETCTIFLRGLEKGSVDAGFGSRKGERSSASFHATSYLKAGAKVHLHKNFDDFVLYNSANYHFTHFSGGLLQEDL